MIRLTDRRLALFFAQVYKPKKLRGRSPRTTKLYGNTLGNFGRYLVEIGYPERAFARDEMPLATWGVDSFYATLDDLDDDIVGGFLSWHIDKGNAPPTANKEAGQLLAMWRLAAEKRFVDEWPDVQLLPEPKRVPQAWLELELQRLFAAAEGQGGMIGHVRGAIWWKALLGVLFYTAERIGATLRLEWKNVDLQNGWVLMPAETRKASRSDKAFPIPRDLCELLRLLYVDGTGLVFVWPFHPDYIYYRYNKILTAAELPTDRKSKFHRIRKTTASYYAAAGGNATELLDHADPRTTKKYLDPRICGDKLNATILKQPWAKK